ncbi:XRE family transcriptional regulator [Streptomyces ziwulingensis]|uniref:HTH cro/C1-type domain-containing protein n=1 Tax=Streptomyces ziwulingensis TaxID=1045501 RepID=A0ABP9CQJ5_9ACTN
MVFTAPRDGPAGGLPAPRRIAWLLRVNRLLGGNRMWATKAYAFAAAFRGGSWPDEADPSRISRWETGSVRVPYLAVRRYEELLGLPPRYLTGAVDTVNRYSAPGTGRDPGGGRLLLARPPRAAAAAGSRVDLVLDAATSGAVVTGADWDDLTVFLATEPGMRLRARDWSAVAHRLLTETVVSDGPAWQQRFEAFNRLLAHPAGGPAAVAAVAAWAADPTNHAYVETVCLLDGSTHPDAARHLLAQLAAPTNEDAHYGALLGCVRKLRHGHLGPEQIRAVAGHAAGLSREPGSRYHDTRTLARSVFALAGSRAPAALSPALREELRRLPASAGPGVPVRRDGERGAVRQDSRVARIVASAVSSAPWGNDRLQDTILPLLVDEALHDPVYDVRLHALLLLRVTPYRTPLAAAVSREIARLGFGRDAGTVIRLFHALGKLGGPAERRQAERVVLRGGAPAGVADAAARALAHMGGRSGDEFWEPALALHTAAVRAGSELSARLVRDLVYALGIGGEQHHLRALAQDRRLPEALRCRAAWWVRLPAHLHRSATASDAGTAGAPPRRPAPHHPENPT